MKTLAHLRTSLRNFRTTGMIARSSRFLCRKMVKHIDWQSAQVIIELGAGDGVLTKYILEKMRPDAVLLCFEINPDFCEILRGVSDKRFHLVEDSAENLYTHLQKYGFEEADAILSAIPFISLPEELTESIVLACRNHLKIGGLFVQFHYSIHMKRFYKRIFGNVRTEFVAINIPPAFVMLCKKEI